MRRACRSRWWRAGMVLRPNPVPLAAALRRRGAVGAERRHSTFQKDPTGAFRSLPTRGKPGPRAGGGGFDARHRLPDVAYRHFSVTQLGIRNGSSCP
jgi:hypothetical protein